MKSQNKITPKEEQEKINRSNVILLFSFYIIVLLWVIVFKCNAYNELHIDKNLAKPLWERFTRRLIPFQDIVVSIATRNVVDILSFFFNIICCIPGGMLLGFFLKKKWGLIWSTVFILGVELFQLFSGWGGFDLTDIFLNVFGVYLGYLVFDWLYPKLSNKAINSAVLITLIPAFAATTFAIVRTILTSPI